MHSWTLPNRRNGRKKWIFEDLQINPDARSWWAASDPPGSTFERFLAKASSHWAGISSAVVTPSCVSWAAAHGGAARREPYQCEITCYTQEEADLKLRIGPREQWSAAGWMLCGRGEGEQVSWKKNFLAPVSLHTRALSVCQGGEGSVGWGGEGTTWFFCDASHCDATHCTMLSCTACTSKTEKPGRKCMDGSKCTSKNCPFAHARYQYSHVHFLLQFLAMHHHVNDTDFEHACAARLVLNTWPEMSLHPAETAFNAPRASAHSRTHARACSAQRFTRFMSYRALCSQT